MVPEGEGNMTIKYRDGRTVEAVILSRDSDSMRVAVKDAEDAVKLVSVHGTWVSEDCEPVRIEFAWERALRERVCMRGRMRLVPDNGVPFYSCSELQC